MGDFFSFPVVRSTISFLFDIRRLKNILFIPFVASLVLSIFLIYNPLFYLKETAEISIGFHFDSILIVCSVLFILSLSIMFDVQKIIFLGEEKKQCLFLKKGKDFKRFFVRFFYLCGGAAFFSLVTGCVLAKVFQTFLGQLYSFPVLCSIATIGLFPYFLTRFSMFMPSSVLNRKITFWQAWVLSGQAGIMFMLNYFFIAMIPFLFILFPISLLFQGVSETFSITLMANMVAFVTLLLSCVLQAAFLGYTYASLDAQNEV